MTEVYTYFEPIISGAERVLSLWKSNWARAGWTPIVLGRSQAMKHPLFLAVYGQARKLPTVNPLRYEISCYLRYLALSAIGGGLMTDFDVMNNGLRPSDIRSDLGFHTLDGHGVPCAVFGTPADYDSFCRRVIEWPLNRFERVRGKPHVSDMYLMVWWQKPTSGQCVEYTDKGWETAPLIHFATARAGRIQQKTAIIQQWLSKKQFEKPAVPVIL
jgi:hypothetical protein